MNQPQMFVSNLKKSFKALFSFIFFNYYVPSIDIISKAIVGYCMCELYSLVWVILQILYVVLDTLGG